MFGMNKQIKVMETMIDSLKQDLEYTKDLAHANQFALRMLCPCKTVRSTYVESFRGPRLLYECVICKNQYLTKLKKSKLKT